MTSGKNFEQLKENVVMLRNCATQMMLLVHSSEAITAAYLNLTFSTFAQLAELRSRVLQFQLDLIEIAVPVYWMLYAGQVDIMWGTKAKEKCDEPDDETGKAKENQTVQKVALLRIVL